MFTSYPPPARTSKPSLSVRGHLQTFVCWASLITTRSEHQLARPHPRGPSHRSTCTCSAARAPGVEPPQGCVAETSLGAPAAAFHSRMGRGPLAALSLPGMGACTFVGSGFPERPPCVAPASGVLGPFQHPREIRFFTLLGVPVRSEAGWGRGSPPCGCCMATAPHRAWR